jgi:hypothetical protein
MKKCNPFFVILYYFCCYRNFSPQAFSLLGLVKSLDCFKGLAYALRESQN